METQGSAAKPIGPANGKAQRSIKNLLIDRRFQLKYTLLVALLALAISVVLGGLLYKELKDNTQVTVTSLTKDLPEAQLKTVEERMAARDTRALLIIVASLGGLVIFILGIGIWLTHKVAGPLFIVGRYLNEVAEGRFGSPRPLRQGDELQDFYDTFQSMMKGLSDRERADLDSVRAALASLAKGNDPSAIQTAVATLRVLEERKQKALN